MTRDDDEGAGRADDLLSPELVAEFRARLGRDARRLAALRDGLAAVAGASPLARDPGWAELDRLAHRLVGAGGTYGFPEVSAAAEDVERLTGLGAGLLAAAEAECRRAALIAVERLQRVLEEACGAGKGSRDADEGGGCIGGGRRGAAAAEEPRPMTVVVRAYRPDDLDRVVALWRDCGLTRPWNDPAADIARCRASAEAALLVGCDGGEPGGGPLVATVMVGHDGHRGWLYYLAVAPDRRGRGLGRRMVAEAEAWLAARGVPKVMLMVREDNTGVVDFYTRQGYATEPRVVLARWLKERPGP